MSYSASSSSQESIGFPQTHYSNRRVLRTADSVDELDALGFAGIPRRYQAHRNDSALSSTSTSSSLSSSSPFDIAPPPSYHPPAYVKFESPEHMLGGYAECGVSDDVIMTTNGDVIKAKLRYKVHKLRMGKHADEWHVFLNRSLKPGEAPWAPAGSPMWKVSKGELEAASASTVDLGMERRSSV